MMLPRDRVSAWLDPTITDADEVAQLLAGLAPAELDAQPVAPAVGNVRNDSSDQIAPLPAAPSQPFELVYA